MGEGKGTISPMLAQPAEEPFDRDDWLFEPKLDGVRCVAFLGSETRLQDRKGKDITYKFPELKELHRQVKKPCVLDGEIVGTSFDQIQRRIHKEKPLDIRIAGKLYPATYYAFDLLSLSGESVMKLPQLSRKELLEEAFSSSERAKVLPFRIGKGKSLFEEIQTKGGEGVMAKALAAPYIEGKRVSWWLKIKNFKEGEFYILGLTQGENEREQTFGSLILGEKVGDTFAYVGNVGSGFDEATLRELLTFFSTLKGEALFREADIDRPVKFWTRPVVKCEIRYLERSSDGKLRFPTFRKLIR